MKLCKKILIGILAILIIMLLIILYRYNILNTIEQRYIISNEKSNLYYYSEAINYYPENNTTSTTISEYWRKDGIVKKYMRVVDGKGTLTFWQDTNTDEEQLVFWSEPEKIYSKSQVSILRIFPYPSTANYETYIRFLIASNPNLHIKTIEYDNKKCYHIKINNQEEIIEKDTGLVLYRYDNGNEIKTNYNFGNVTDEEVRKPDTTQYKFREATYKK